MDISHSIGPQNIRQAAYLLGQSWRSFPEGSVHLAVVDPGVGGDRLPLAARIDGQYFVCPDNGILSEVISAGKKLEFRIINNERLFNQEVSSTFHGRDIFAPVAGWLLAGGEFEDAGPELENPVLLPEVLFSLGAEFISAEIIHIDTFGNVVTSIKRDEVTRDLFENTSFALHINDICIKDYFRNYASAGEKPFILWGSGGHLEISLKNSSAANLLAAHCGQKFTLTLNHS